MVSVAGFKGWWFLSLVSVVRGFCRWFQRSVISVVGFKGSCFLSLFSKVGDFCRWFQRSVISVWTADRFERLCAVARCIRVCCWAKPYGPPVPDMIIQNNLSVPAFQ